MGLSLVNNVELTRSVGNFIPRRSPSPGFVENFGRFHLENKKIRFVYSI